MEANLEDYVAGEARGGTGVSMEGSSSLSQSHMDRRLERLFDGESHTEIQVWPAVILLSPLVGYPLVNPIKLLLNKATCLFQPSNGSIQTFSSLLAPHRVPGPWGSPGNDGSPTRGSLTALPTSKGVCVNRGSSNLSSLEALPFPPCPTSRWL